MQAADFTFNTTGRIPTAVGWVGKTWEFTASAAQTTVEFLSLNPEGSPGPLLDNIALVPVRAAEEK